MRQKQGADMPGWVFCCFLLVFVHEFWNSYKLEPWACTTSRTVCKSYNKSITALLWVGQYRGIFSSRLLYCPSLRSGQYCQPRTEYSPVLPSQSCSNIYVIPELLSLIFLIPSSFQPISHFRCPCNSTGPVRIQDHVLPFERLYSLDSEPPPPPPQI